MWVGFLLIHPVCTVKKKKDFRKNTTAKPRPNEPNVIYQPLEWYPLKASLAKYWFQLLAFASSALFM